MNLNATKLLAAGLLGLSLTAATPADTQTALPSWMAGGWEQRSGEVWVDEYWTPSRGGLMNGSSRTGKGDTIQFWEQTRIQRKADGSLSYFAMPQGAPATEFVQAKRGPRMIEFANPGHDYPQRIRYWLEGRELRAEVSLIDGSKTERWTFRRIR